MARTPSDITETTEPQVVRTKRVIIQRPAGNKDIGLLLGFNDTSAMYPFDKPVEMPADMVDYFRAQKVATPFPGENSEPVITYTNQFHIIDAD